MNKQTNGRTDERTNEWMNVFKSISWAEADRFADRGHITNN